MDANIQGALLKYFQDQHSVRLLVTRMASKGYRSEEATLGIGRKSKKSDLEFTNEGVAEARGDGIPDYCFGPIAESIRENRTRRLRAEGSGVRDVLSIIV